MGVIGDNVSQAARAAGLRQREVARRLGMAEPTVNEWFNEITPRASIGIAVRISRAIGCSLDVLVKGLDPLYDAQRKGVTSPVNLTVEDGASQEQEKLDVPTNIYDHLCRLIKDLDFEELTNLLRDVTERAIRRAAREHQTPTGTADDH